MKNNLIILLLAVILMTSFNVPVLAKEMSEDIRDKEFILIKLTDEKDIKSETKKGIVKSSVMSQEFSIDYRTDNNYTLVGKKDKDDLINLLWIASKITGDKYELLDKRTVLYNDYNGRLEVFGYNYMTIVLNIYKNNMLVKTLEFAPTWISNSSLNNSRSKSFEIDNTMPHPHIFNYMNDEIGYYYLPLRYIFEELGFNVSFNAIDNTIIISEV